MACKHLQSAYVVLNKELKQGWAFVQQVTPDIEDAFGPVGKALRDTFVPALFQWVGEGTLDWGVTCFQ